VTAGEALRICFTREHLRRTVRIALVVGTILTLINQLDVFLKGDEVALTWVKCALNYCVPFVVSNLGRLAGKRAEEHLIGPHAAVRVGWQIPVVVSSWRRKGVTHGMADLGHVLRPLQLQGGVSLPPR
jgi:hypothetical protein